MILFKRFRKCNNTNVHEDVTDFDQSNFDECNTFVQDPEILLVCRDAHIQILNEKYMTKVENFVAHNDYFTGRIDNKHCVCRLLNEVGNFERSRGRG